MQIESDKQYRQQMDTYLNHSYPQSLLRICFFIDQSTTIMQNNDEQYFVLDLVDVFPFLRHGLADIVRQDPYNWRFIASGARRETDYYQQSGDINFIVVKGGSADHRLVKFLDGDLDAADVSTHANLEQLPLRKLRSLRWNSYSDIRSPSAVHCRVDTDKQIQQLASLDVEELQLFPYMPSADRVCQLIQEVKPTRLGVALHDLSELINEVGASALREKLTNLQHLVIQNADEFRYGNDFHGALDMRDSAWEFISSLPNLRHLQFYEFPWISGGSSVQMRECFRKVNILEGGTNRMFLLFPDDVIEEFGKKMTIAWIPHTLSSDITGLCPNVEHLYIDYDFTFIEFLNICALPKIRRIRCDGNLKLNESERAIMIEILCSRRLETIQIYEAMFSASDVKKIFRFQGEGLKYFGMGVSSKYGAESLRTITHTVMESAIRWTPNLSVLEMLLLSDDEPFDISINHCSPDLLALRETLRLRCPSLCFDSDVKGLEGLGPVTNLM